MLSMRFSVEALVLKQGNVEIGGSTRSLLAASVKVDGVEKKNLREQTGLCVFGEDPRQSRLSGPVPRAAPKIFQIQMLGIEAEACKSLLIAGAAAVEKRQPGDAAPGMTIDDASGSLRFRFRFGMHRFCYTGQAGWQAPGCRRWVVGGLSPGLVAQIPG
jgi:hypothetical protein